MTKERRLRQFLTLRREIDPLQQPSEATLHISLRKILVEPLGEGAGYGAGKSIR